MVKPTKQRYQISNQKVDLESTLPISYVVPRELRSIYTTMTTAGVAVKIVLIQNRNKKSERLTILSTDCSLTEKEIIRIYGMRWDIEVFFKATKSLLKLQKSSKYAPTIS